MRFASSHNYDQFALLVGYCPDREHWSLDQLLASRLTLDEAAARMERGLALRSAGPSSGQTPD